METILAHPECTTSRVWPIVDTVAATLIGAAGVAYTVEGIREPDSDFAALPAGILYLATAALYGLSAFSGYRSTSQCREWLLSASEIKGLSPFPASPNP